MTREEYHRLAPVFDYNRHMAECEIREISPRVNRAGNYYRGLVKHIRNKWNV